MSLQALSLFVSAKLIPFALALIGFGALIAIHEFGHFIFCKLFGIRTPTFSIGFGPEIIRKQIGQTNFRLAIIPLGGYVEIAGLAEVGQGDQEHSELSGPESFDSKPYWQKFLVLFGGILFNLLFAYGVFCGLFMIGSNDPQSVVVAGIMKDSAAEKFGLKTGDGLIAINHNDQTTSLLDAEKNLIDNAHTKLLDIIKSNPNNDIQFVLHREKEQITLPITLGSRTEKEQIIGSLGAELRTPLKKLPFFQAIVAGINHTNHWICQIVASIKKLVTSRSLEGAGGPVMIMSMSFASAQHGLIALLTFLALISINLALLNVLPIGALDGGQLLFVTIESILGRKMPLALRNGINIASWLMFVGLAVFLTYKDIATLFGDKLVTLCKKMMALVR